MGHTLVESEETFFADCGCGYVPGSGELTFGGCLGTRLDGVAGRRGGTRGCELDALELNGEIAR